MTSPNRFQPQTAQSPPEHDDAFSGTDTALLRNMLGLPKLPTLPTQKILTQEPVYEVLTPKGVEPQVPTDHSGGRMSVIIESPEGHRIDLGGPQTGVLRAFEEARKLPMFGNTQQPTRQNAKISSPTGDEVSAIGLQNEADQIALNILHCPTEDAMFAELMGLKQQDQRMYDLVEERIKHYIQINTPHDQTQEASSLDSHCRGNENQQQEESTGSTPQAVNFADDKREKVVKTAWRRKFQKMVAGTALAGSMLIGAYTFGGDFVAEKIDVYCSGDLSIMSGAACTLMTEAKRGMN